MHFFPNYIAATIAVFTAAMVHRLGTDVTRARRLGSYRLVERLGQGGVGEVWRAEHESLIRPAAVQLVRSDLPIGRTGPTATCSCAVSVARCKSPRCSSRRTPWRCTISA